MKTTEDIIEDVLELYIKSGSIIDSICEIAEKENIEIENISTIFNKNPQLKELIRTEAIKANMVHE